MRTRMLISGIFFTLIGLGLFIAGVSGWAMPDNMMTAALGSLVILFGASEFERGGL